MLVHDIMRIATDAGNIALSANRTKSFVTKDGRANFVTEYDKRVQSYLVQELEKLISDAHFVCEESNLNQGWDENSMRFIIDPIDGTTNFIHNAPEYAVCIGLMQGNKQICGVVHCPVMNTVYFAEAGHGAFVKHTDSIRQIHTSVCGLDNAVIAAGTTPYREDLIERSFVLARKLLFRAADTRRSGSAAIDICRVAEGVYDLMFEYNIYPWDYTAASIIVAEAGGSFSDFNGNKITHDAQTSFIAASPQAQKEFVEYYKSLDLQ